ncbi:YhcN/YlaJ family sporulation lipoprotein [Virgibacillus soli]|uniref:YhcN/YlaJ family sporulation lipoprotein n=1 Tax=Paracerasibacillus soli TaxID=480284 RepID=A0ABU5CN48_9BACI|nr:YhcN/YlaJ family sporulation lipoprotein [Virgibacillus soli]MDY0407792.1 YhcN/YlaJ family sporulation lipoprotein [Virgibacillus soli]
MKRKVISLAAVATIALAGCNANNDGATNNKGTNNGAEPTRYHQNANDNVIDRNMERTGYRGNDRFNGSNRYNDDNYNTRDVRNDNRGNVNNNTRYDVAKEAADRIVRDVPEIDRAYVLTTNNNAYVAAQLDTNDNRDGVKDKNNNGDKLTDSVKRKVSDIVKSVDNRIDNVYVSTNPDFYNLTNNYVDDMDQGRPVRGFFDQFGNMIERLFPQNR